MVQVFPVVNEMPLKRTFRLLRRPGPNHQEENKKTFTRGEPRSWIKVLPAISIVPCPGFVAVLTGLGPTMSLVGSYSPLVRVHNKPKKKFMSTLFSMPTGLCFTGRSRRSGWSGI